MKRKLLYILILGSLNIYGQQLINGNMELWTTESYGIEPSNWSDGGVGFGTYNYFVGFGEGDPLTTLKISGAQAAGGAGNSVLLETKASVGSTLINAGYPKIYGMLSRKEAFTGSVPSSISFDVKPEVLIGDTAYVYVTFLDAANNVIKYVYEEWVNSNNSWQNIVSPVIDNSVGTITQIKIECVSSYSLNGTELIGSKLSLDNFTLNYPCQNDPQVFLTNMAFYSAVQATSSMGASGFGLPTTLNPNPNNTYNFLDIGKPIRFKVKCKNSKTNGASITSGQCRISTSDPNIQLIDSLSGLNNIGWNSEAWSTDEFEIMVSNSVTTSYTAYVDFIVIENGIEYITQCVPIPVKPFSLSNFTIDDDNNPDSQGDGDLIVEPNEIIEVQPFLNNTSEFSASLVKGYLYNLDNFSSISIWNGVQGASGTVNNNSLWNYNFGQAQPIPAGTTNATSQYDFVFNYNLSSLYSFDLFLATHGEFYLFGVNNPTTLIRTTNKLSFNIGNPVAPISGSFIPEVQDSGITIYPNPASDYLIIDTKYLISNVVCIDMSGKRIELIEQNGQYNTEQLQNGMYSLRVTFIDGSEIITKVIINK